MLAPDSKDVFDKLRHAVAVSGSGLPIHKGDEPPPPEEPPPPAMPYDEAGVFDIAALQSSLGDSLTQLEADAEARKAEEEAAEIAKAEQARHAEAEAAAAAAVLHQPVLNPVLPRDFMAHYSDFEEEENRSAPKLLVFLLVGVALIIGGGAVVARKAGWMSLSAVHITSGKGKAAEGTAAPGAGQGNKKVLQPPPPGGPSIEDIQGAADAAVSSHYASVSVTAETKAVLNSLRVIARQPTDNPSNWQVLMTVTVRQQPSWAPNRAIERKEGYPERGQSTVMEVPRNAGAEGAPPPVPVISGPLPSPQAADAVKDDSGKDDKNKPQSSVRRAGPPALPEPQPRWVSVDWSGERWFIGDYEFD